MSVSSEPVKKLGQSISKYQGLPLYHHPQQEKYKREKNRALCLFSQTCHIWFLGTATSPKISDYLKFERKLPRRFSIFHLYLCLAEEEIHSTPFSAFVTSLDIRQIH